MVRLFYEFCIMNLNKKQLALHHLTLLFLLQITKVEIRHFVSNYTNITCISYLFAGNFVHQ